MIKKCNVTQCKKCLKIKRHGKFQTLSNYEMELLKESCDIVNVIEECCEDCQNGFHGQGCT